MKSLRKLALISSLTVALGVPGWAAQYDNVKGKAPVATEKKTDHAKTTHGATHRTTGTIKSIDADKVVLDHKVNGKTEEVTIMLNTDTVRTGSLNPGDRVSVQWRDENNQKMAKSIKEMPAKSASKPAKTSTKPTKS